jgi:DDE superfamily endonuclease
MAEDEACFGRLSIPRRAWAPAGVRPHAPQQLIREYSYVYAAVAPAEGKMTSLILPSADTEMMNLFLEHVSKTYEKYFVVMQVDQASWHGAKDLRIPDNMRLIAQPAYSPERESTWNISGKNCAKNSSRISLFPHLMRSLTGCVMASTSWKPTRSVSVL